MIRPLQLIEKITTLGLLSAKDSIAYRLAEIERHHHSYECWFEKAATPSGETNVADIVGDGTGAFQIDAGNNDWGSWVQILGSSDTPCRAGSAYFDLNTIQFTAAERNALYYVQIAFGTSAAQALTDGTFTKVPYMAQGTTGAPHYNVIQSRRQAAGTKVWARCKCPGQNTATLDFVLGLHEYEG